ncbi:uncharacterized protein PpBr36_09212 [Pyricularia pennisetigena]|uniref:uncharacterized protein n=1 Tax=Pyricularia pennisetigena TaxID=1578925 RepID=UPI00114EF8FE|nr:uncharacterized protein PpBr36_09212 [Pyricularia pennisetigena]TLS22057.1 hypothetical protein PpBr36_09212 [Pyricularia pennisetigena]
MEVRTQARMPLRPVLEEASMRANHSKSQNSATPSRCQHADIKTENIRPAQPQKPRQHNSVDSSHVPLNPRLYEIREEAQSTPESKRESQASTASYAPSSSNTFRKPKTHVGPWQLGKTLGKGSSARVRLARHTSTHQYVAVKIIAKSTCKMTQAGSLAKLDEVDSAAPDKVEGMRRMPIALEREVAILKLIEHPNIVKLYDIWENSNEIYLILEYVERGDLFDFISKHGPMPEEEALFVFRQIMSALEYCHSYGICHRDLKPENILLKGNGQVKIADFGMAALHQGPRTPLWTFCGSPHYAAPELLREKAYRGEKSDIWSMGVILFAMMAARLPFDDEDMNLMFAKARKAIYHMPSHFSDEAKDFIHRLLQVDPRKRLSMRQMWQHPVVWKYGYLDELGGEGIPEVPNPKARQEIKPLDLCDIDPQILRQIQSMWHTMSEDELVKKLISADPNDQKLFYWLLNGYRERQLENYDPSLTHSPSDYHHIRPPLWSTKVSTRQFMTNKASGHGRSISKFTVISNVTDTGTGANLGTVRSYDPYKSPAVKQPYATHAKIVIHRDTTDPDRKTASLGSTSCHKPRANSTGSWKRPRRSQLGNRILTPRSTASSVQSNRKFHARSRTGSRHKRAMDFSVARRKMVAAKLNNQQTLLGTDGKQTVPEWNKKCSSDPDLPANMTDSSNAKLRSKDRLHEELRHFSSSIAKDCDDAFNSSVLSVSQFDGDRSRQGSPFSLSLGTPMFATPVTPVATPTIPRPSARPWDSRPLPPTPPSSSHETESTVNSAKNPSIPVRRGQPPTQGYSLGFGPVATTPTPSDRRVVSAPVHGGQYGECVTRQLPSIDEGTPNIFQDEVNRSRIVSLPVKPSAAVPTPNEARGLEFLSKADKTIRIVHSPSAKRESGIARHPYPIHANAKASKTLGTSTGPVTHTSVDPYRADDPSIGHGNTQLAQTSSQGSASTFAMRKKTSSWFKRLSRESRSSKGSLCDGLDDAKSTDVPCVPTSVPKKDERANSSSIITHRPPEKTSNTKKSFFLPFWRNNKAEPRMSLAEPDFEESPSTETERAAKSHKTSGTNLLHFDDAESAERMIKPQQNWLARLFRVKPATRAVCLSISRRRARQEVAILLRDWRKYGIRDVEVDKKRNVVFARLSSKNHLNIKEVAFACEIITVIEHGKRNHLSIIRFTQEKGAASSFQRVVDTMRDVLGNRNLLVTDKSKAKMMIKTLNS